MKANIPSRIAFAVSSALESRIIWTSRGRKSSSAWATCSMPPWAAASPARAGRLCHRRGARGVIDFIKEGSVADYSEEHPGPHRKGRGRQGKAHQEDSSSGEGSGDNPFGDYDELLPQAVDVILDTKQAPFHAPAALEAGLFPRRPPGGPDGGAGHRGSLRGLQAEAASHHARAVAGDEHVRTQSRRATHGRAEGRFLGRFEG